MTDTTAHGHLWTQDQAIAYEAAIEAINDVIARYSEQIAIAEQLQSEEAATRIARTAHRPCYRCQ